MTENLYDKPGKKDDRMDDTEIADASEYVLESGGKKSEWPNNKREKHRQGKEHTDRRTQRQTKKKSTVAAFTCRHHASESELHHADTVTEDCH